MTGRLSKSGVNSSGGDGNARSAFVLERLDAMLRRILKIGHSVPFAACPLSELGLSSMGAITLQYQLEKEFGADLTIGDILDGKSIDALAATVLSRLPSADQIGGPTNCKNGVLI
ncbi:acyl carrier protein [uncultured Bradyrhizobium sp.]|uniref:acyl carrier protein n=1 Tax=uncultured Bradyrhizobium sp. TaxID=199684 RepID=UPI0035CC59B2